VLLVSSVRARLGDGDGSIAADPADSHGRPGLARFASARPQRALPCTL